MATHTFFCVDGHTCGNPVRLVAGGGPRLEGANMVEKRAHFLAEFDWVRTGLMFEPRGHDMMSGAILYPPTRPDADIAFLFIETSGCLPMCGHGTIGTVTMALERGLVTPKTPGVLKIDTPAGLVTATYVQNGPYVDSVRITSGYSAAFRAAEFGVALDDHDLEAQIGGVCLNVGCIPSKALLHVAAVLEDASHLGALGIEFGPPTLDVGKLRAHKAKVIAKLTGGLAAMAKMRKVTVLRGYGAFVGPHQVQVEATHGSGQEQTGSKQVVSFKACIIAVGSQAVRLPFMPDDPRVVDSTGALALPGVPKNMLIIGGGIIGLEMGTVYSALGARLDVVEMLDGLMPGADRDLVKVWEKMNKGRFDRILLKTKTVAATATAEGIRVQFEGLDGSTSEGTYDLVLQAVGRAPNGRKIAAEQAGVAVNERGFIPVDAQMRSNVPHIFAIGDVVGQPMLAHKAVHEAHVAAEVVAGELLGRPDLAAAAFDARVIPSVAYTDPELAWVGLTEDQAKAQGIAVRKGLFPWSASGRALANGCEQGFTKLLFDDRPEAGGHGRILGGGIVGRHAGDLIGEVALAIEMGADAVDIGKTIHPHPTLGESIGLAAEAAHGSCTDLPPQRG